MKNLLSLIVLFIALHTSAQTINDVYGEWKFESVAEGQMEKKGDVEKLAPYLDKLFFRFYPDGNYESGIMGMNEAGKFSMQGNKIITNNGKSKAEVTVLAATPGKLTIKITGLVANMVQVAPAGNKLILANTWLLSSIRKPGYEEVKVNDKSAVNFKPDGTYSIALGATKETGYWDYREIDGKKVVVLNADGRVKYWPVISIDAKQLILSINSSGQEFIFTAH